MRHGAECPQVVVPCRPYIAGPGEPADDGCAAGVVAPQSLRPAQPEVDEQPVSGGKAHAAGLGGDK
jgi:hypothetical protein